MQKGGGGGGGIRILVGLLPEIRRWQERRAKFGKGFTWETGAWALYTRPTVKSNIGRLSV